jgi:hypothetical protein
MQGFNTFGVTPDCVVEADEDDSFEGTVTCNLKAESGNGCMVGFYGNFEGQATKKGLVDLLKDKEFALQVDNAGRKTKFKSIVSSKPFGNSCLGISFFSNNNIVGESYAVSNVDANAPIKNPFNVASLDADIPNLNSATSAYVRGVINAESKITSPYLINPGEKLIFAVSKTRPVYLEDENGQLTFNSSHDIMITEGSLNIKIYGTYLNKVKR